MTKNIKYEFYLDYIKCNFGSKKVFGLDYGCGKGRFIEYAKNNGLSFSGVENFYGKVDHSDATENINGIVIHIIREDGTMPFRENSFDIVTSMQVFEHVEDLELVLSEIQRVLKPEGVVLCDFPLQYSVNEPHYNIPFSHWFPKNSRLRKPWCLMLYKLGLGSNRETDLSFDEWYDKAFNFIDNYCHYRSESNFRKLCKQKGFKIKSFDYQRLMFKLNFLKRKYRILYYVLKLFPGFIIAKIIRIRGSSMFELRNLS